MRSIDKLGNVSGKSDEWPSWDFELSLWMGVRFQKGEQFLDWAQRQSDKPIGEASAEQTATQFPALPRMTQL